MNQRRTTLKDLITRFRQVWGERFDYSLVTEENFINMKTPIPIKCNLHGCVFTTRPSDHLRGIGGCKQCKNESISQKKKGVPKGIRKKVLGIGVYNSEEVLSLNDICYNRWLLMLHRCYDEKIQSKHPTYKGCSVCSEWLYFSNFKEWFDKNYIEGYHLDKDILVKGNKVYSPTTCCFVPQRINKLVLTNQGRRNGLIGVMSKPYNRWEACHSFVDETGKKGCI